MSCYHCLPPCHVDTNRYITKQSRLLVRRTMSKAVENLGIFSRKRNWPFSQTLDQISNESALAFPPVFRLILVLMMIVPYLAHPSSRRLVTNVSMKSSSVSSVSVISISIIVVVAFFQTRKPSPNPPIAVRRVHLDRIPAATHRVHPPDHRVDPSASRESRRRNTAALAVAVAACAAATTTMTMTTVSTRGRSRR